jgi:hypothetical protein
MDGGRAYKGKKIIFPHPSLPVLTALTPPDIEDKIIVECSENVSFDQKI